MSEKSVIIGHKEYESFIRRIYFFQKESIECKRIMKEGETEQDPWLKNLEDIHKILGRTQVGGRPKIHQFLPFFVWGDTGLGKSQATKLAALSIARTLKKTLVPWNLLYAKEMDKIIADEDIQKRIFGYFDLRVSMMADSSELRGIMNMASKDIVDFIPPRMVKLWTSPHLEGIVLLDEFNLASDWIMKLCYQMIHDRAIGDNAVNDNILFIGAGNRKDDGGHTYKIPRPLRARFMHIELVNDIDQWFNWAVENGVDMSVLAYHKTFEGNRIKTPNNSEYASVGTFRTWTSVGRYLQKVSREEVIKENSIHRTIISAIVGEAEASQYIEWCREDKIMNQWKSYVDEPKQILDLDLSQRLSLISIISEKYRVGEITSLKLMEVFWVLASMSPEIAVDMMRIILNMGERFDEDVQKVPEVRKEWRKIIDKYHTIFMRGRND